MARYSKGMNARILSKFLDVPIPFVTANLDNLERFGIT